MSLMDDGNLVVNYYKKYSGLLAHNEQIFNIYEGGLIDYVKCDLMNQFSKDTYKTAEHRIAPINLLKRLIQKLSTLYNCEPERTVSGTPLDAAMIETYIDQLSMNVYMSQANEFFNQFKNYAIEPYLDAKSYPKMRIIPSDRFFVFSNDDIDPMNVTHFVKVMVKNRGGKNKMYFYTYTDQEFAIIGEDGKVDRKLMAEMGLDGTNPYGKIPFVYSVRSAHNLMPIPDSDLLSMVKLFPVLLTDLNYASMFQSFSIIYGIDVDDEAIKMAPNAFWRFKSDPNNPGQKPEIGTIKPTVDSEKIIQLIQTEMSMWLQSRNIRPGNSGQLNSENFSSGVSKMVDEMDTVEDRKKQIPFFIKAEADFFDLLINHLHPVWIQQPDYWTRSAFSPKASVSTEFEEQKAVRDMSAIIQDAIALRNAGLINDIAAIKMVYPSITDEEMSLIMPGQSSGVLIPDLTNEE